MRALGSVVTDGLLHLGVAQGTESYSWYTCKFLPQECHLFSHSLSTACPGWGAGLSASSLHRRPRGRREAYKSSMSRSNTTRLSVSSGQGAVDESRDLPTSFSQARLELSLNLTS